MPIIHHQETATSEIILTRPMSTLTMSHQRDPHTIIYNTITIPINVIYQADNRDAAKDTDMCQII